MLVGWAAPPAAEAGNHDQNSKLERLGLSGPSRRGPARGPSSRAPLEGSESESGSDSDLGAELEPLNLLRLRLRVAGPGRRGWASKACHSDWQWGKAFSGSGSHGHWHPVLLLSFEFFASDTHLRCRAPGRRNWQRDNGNLDGPATKLTACHDAMARQSADYLNLETSGGSGPGRGRCCGRLASPPAVSPVTV